MIDDTVSVPNLRYALSVYVDASGQPIDDSVEAYVDGELQPDVVRGSDWEHFPYAEITYYCNEHQDQEVHENRPCRICGRRISD